MMVEWSLSVVEGSKGRGVEGGDGVGAALCGRPTWWCFMDAQRGRRLIYNYPVRDNLCITPGFNRGCGDAGRSTVRVPMPMDAKTMGSDGRMYC